MRFSQHDFAQKNGEPEKEEGGDGGRNVSKQKKTEVASGDLETVFVERKGKKGGKN